MRGVPITRVSGPDSPADWVLLLTSDDRAGSEWLLVPSWMADDVSGVPCASYPADGYEDALSLARIVQDSVDEHGARAVMRHPTETVSGRFYTDAAARFFARVVLKERTR